MPQHEYPASSTQLGLVIVLLLLILTFALDLSYDLDGEETAVRNNGDEKENELKRI